MSLSNATVHAADVHAPASTKGPTLVLLMVALALVGLALAVKTWGLVALTMAAYPFIPLMFFVFIWISLP